MAPVTFRLHKHCWIAGPNANRTDRYQFEHSHEGGDVPHTHPDTGPSYFRDHRRTKKPKGPQVEGYRATLREELLFDVVFTKSAQMKAGPGAEPGGVGMVERRLMDGFGLLPVVRFEP